MTPRASPGTPQVRSRRGRRRGTGGQLTRGSQTGTRTPRGQDAGCLDENAEVTGTRAEPFPLEWGRSPSGR